MKRRKISLTSEREESSPTTKKLKPVVVLHSDQRADENESQSESADGRAARDLRMLEATLVEILTKRGSEKTC
jgi:hypothetical protein